MEVPVTEQEVKIVQHFANDMRSEQVAQILGIKKRTLDSQVDKLRLRMRLKTIHGLVYSFCKNGLIQ